MKNEIDQQAASTNAGKSTTAFTEENIKRLKGRLEEARARSHTRSHWEGMIEDCEIILNHLQSRKRTDGNENVPRNAYASINSNMPVREHARP